MPGFESGGNSVIVYFSSEDCAVEHARAVEAGGQSIKPKTAIPPFGFIALIRDPDGNRIGIHSAA
jgi:predicted enzyme related to lactoylglutathione lyase